LRVVILADRVVELLLHAGDVGVGRFDDKAGPGAELRIGSDVTIDDHHMLLRDIRVLKGGDALKFFSANGLTTRVCRIVDKVGGPGAA
jgi:hypothetical protein